ncbi:mitochondrial cardiolipin hydrolase [Bombina bombina]|uniref:mitochondrial cardiolipin hydrolase n=1 Tax=Bombina bombina TaxID=8345 RepID=UPI00235B13A4|nr:mitochondrial cardiolipin hydrolase [Bombina bombina]
MFPSNSSMLCAVPWRILGLAGLGLALTLESLYWLFKRRRSVREVLFFPVPLTCTEPLLYPGIKCQCRLPHTESALSRLLRRLLRAQRTLELCVFTFSSESLARAVLLLQSRGVRIRVITDSDYMAATGSQIGNLRSAGILVRHNQTSGFMHHKFAVLDRTVVITGSMNWTSQAIQTNRENLIITDDRSCVTAYLEEFERLWKEYDPVNYDFCP